MSLVVIVALAILAAVAVTVVVFVLEIVAILRKMPDEQRPGKLVLRAALALWRGAKAVGELWGLLFDVFGVFKRLALWVRRIFFAWIPKEVFEEALQVLGQTYRTLLHVPVQFAWGVLTGLSEATFPILSHVLFVPGVLLSLTGWQLMAIAFDLPAYTWPLRWGRAASWLLGILEPVWWWTWNLLTNLPAAIQQILEYVRGWFSSRTLDVFRAEFGALVADWRNPWVYVPALGGVLALVAYVIYVVIPARLIVSADPLPPVDAQPGGRRRANSVGGH